MSSYKLTHRWLAIRPRRFGFTRGHSLHLQHDALFDDRGNLVSSRIPLSFSTREILSQIKKRTSK